MVQNYFPSVLGLTQTKRKLEFFINSYRKTQIFPNLLICAGRGQGKTFLAYEVARNLKELQKDKECLLINCGTLKDFNSFVTQIYIPHIADRNVTVAFDECHELPDKLTTGFLTLFNTTRSLQTSYTYNDLTINFDFRKQTFMFMTSESQKVFHALQDRLEKIALEPYSVEELSHIIKKNLPPELKIENGLLEQISLTVRGNPRKAIQTAEKINCNLKTGQNSFTQQDWSNIINALDIMPLGVNRIELELMKILSQRKTCNLTTLAAHMGMSRESLMRDHELYLLKHNLIEIAVGSKRQLTNFGYRYLLNMGLV